MTHRLGSKYCKTCEKVQNYDHLGCKVCGREVWKDKEVEK